MGWESTTHRCHMPPHPSVSVVTYGVGSVWVCEDEWGDPDRPVECSRRWRVVEFVGDRVRWEPVEEPARQANLSPEMAAKVRLALRA